MIRVILLPLFVFLFSCGAKKAPKEYLDEKKQLLVYEHFQPYFLLKPDKLEADDRFNDTLAEYYKNQAKLTGMELKSYFVYPDSVHAALFVRRDLKSLYVDFRALGATFRMNQDSIYDVELHFLTQMVRKDTIDRISEILFTELVKSKNINKYVADREMIFWPSVDVEFSKAQKKWVMRKDSDWNKILEASKE